MKNRFKFSLTLLSVLIALFFVVACSDNNGGQDKTMNDKRKEIASMLSLAEKSDLTPEKRKNALVKAYSVNAQLEIDSVRIYYLKKIAYQALNVDDSIFFKQINKEVAEFMRQKKDTSGLAEVHWNYGAYYASREIYDSAYVHYNQAQKYYKSQGKDYFSARMLYNMAFIRGRLKDYTGSEELTFRAISIYQRLNKPKALYDSYNHIAILYYELEEYDRALFYNNKALEYSRMSKDRNIDIEGALNNIGLIYQAKNQYEMAGNFYGRALQKDDILKKTNIVLYARLVDNKAFSDFLSGDSKDALESLKLALHIRDSIGDHSGIIVSKLHLAEYYLKQNDTFTSVKYGKDALSLAKKIKNNRDYLTSLKFLANTEKDSAVVYLNKYVELSANLKAEERRIRNKYTRIDYETNQYIKKAERLSKENLLIITIGVFLILIIALLFFITRQRLKSRALLFESEQQRANEQIYLLSLEKSTQLQEGIIQERNRISEELHDGILGKLFGTRIGMDFLSRSTDVETERMFGVFIKELQIIEKEIREISHELKDHDVFNANRNFFILIENLIKKNCEIGDIKYRLTKDNNIPWEKFDEISKANLYRIIQEAILNTLKYAQASKVHISFSKHKENLILKITDDGVGFKTGKRTNGIGLRNMVSRTKKLNGQIYIKSELNKGTKIKISVPIIKNNEEDI